MTAVAARSPTPQDRAERLRRAVLADLDVDDRRLTCGGRSTAILQAGDGPPIVLLHGAGEFGAIWTRVLPHLASRHAVVAPDLPGHGATDDDGGPLGAGVVLEWLADVVRQTCGSPPVLVGRGLGGAIAARFAVRQPGAIRGLVLVDAYGLAPLRPAPAFALALIPFMLRPTESTHRRLLQRCVADGDGLKEAMGERLDRLQAYAVDRARHGSATSAVRRMMPEIGRPAVPASDLARIAVPTTLIWGRHDLQVRVAVAEAAGARHGWPLHVIEEAGDDPPVEEPEAFLRALHAGIAACEETT